MVKFKTKKYSTTLKLILLKAVNDLFPNRKVIIDNSLNNGVYGYIEKFSLTEEDVEKISNKMKEIIEKNYPIELISNNNEELKARSSEIEREDVRKLLDNSGWTSIMEYAIDGYHDYVYERPYKFTGDVDLFELTREIVSRLSLTAAQRNIHMELTGESVKIHGIRQILDEMIYNITENAVKYNKENGNVTIWVGNTLEGPKVRVSDTGIGIPKEHQDRIFERFYRVDKSHSKERGGTGLGLSIVKHGAILHGAKVQVDSEYGKGTRMEIIFPGK